MIVVPSHPPAFVSFPWYNLIVRINNPGTVVTNGNLFTAMVSQLNLVAGSTASGFAVRLQSVRFWGAIVAPSQTSPLAPCFMSVIDPITILFGSSAARNVLEQLTDYPDMFQRACVGYHYPKAQREYSLPLDNSAQNYELLNLSGGGPNSVLYFSLQWRINNRTVPSTLAETPQNFVQASAPPTPYGWVNI